MLESEIQKMNPDMEAIELYRQKDADYTARLAELEAATAERDEVRDVCVRAFEMISNS